MKIGFDGKRAVANMTGLGNYSRLVIEQLAGQYTDIEYLVYTPKLKGSRPGHLSGVSANPRLKGIEAFPNVSYRLPRGGRPGGALWRSWGICRDLKADGLDLYHGLSNELPLNIASAGVPSVVTVHDVIYRREPAGYSAIDRRLYDFKYGRSCRAATRIVAISECTRRDICEFYGIDPSKIDVVYQGCDDSFRKDIPPEELAEVHRRLRLPAKYILQVGTIEPRKNLELSVRALQGLPGDVVLLAVGRDRLGYLIRVKELARSLGVEHRLDVRSDIGFADLPAVCRQAEVIVYPSRYEGFGLPVLEGLESRRPVVAACGSCLEEAGGDAAIYVSPDDARGLAEAIRATLTGETDVEAMVGRGLDWARRFDTGAMAGKIMDVYRRAVSDYASGK